jgi:alkanesulfonate monooxygenase SsuD/methylene tetrahydromethanopterin reductase-like flavin-dependent oxidoreductase (luciferase family)
MHLTDDPTEANSILSMLVSPRQAPSDLRDRSLIGTAEECVAKLRKLEAAGVEQVLVWPIRDEARQLQRFAEEVATKFQSPVGPPASLRHLNGQLPRRSMIRADLAEEE